MMEMLCGLRWHLQLAFVSAERGVAGRMLTVEGFRRCGRGGSGSRCRRLRLQVALPARKRHAGC